MEDTFNGWFLSLHERRQAILREDKWMLAENAFEAGKEVRDHKTKEALQGVALMLRTELKEYVDEPWAKRVLELVP